MKFLVTGGAGFIGSHIVENLIKDGHQARVLDNFSTGKEENLAFIKDRRPLEVIKGDIRDTGIVEKAARGMDGIFHLAALVFIQESLEHLDLSFDINTRGTITVFNAARTTGIKRVIFASSAAVYGDNATQPLSEDVPASPLTPYAIDKYCGELYAAQYASLYNLKIISLRYFNVYGSRQDSSSPYSGVISKFIVCLKIGEGLTVYVDGEQTRDFVHVSDVVQENMAAMHGPDSGFLA